MTRQVYYAEQALLPDGWAHKVQIEIENGVIQRVIQDCGAEDVAEHAVRLSGPVIPAMANLHSHAFQRAMAGMAEVSRNPHDSFWSWREVMYQMVQRLTPDDVRVIATTLYIDLLKAGYSQVAEFNYLHHQPDGRPYLLRDEMARQLIQAAECAGLGLTLLPVLYSYAGFAELPPQIGQRRFINDSDDFLALHQACGELVVSHPLHQLGVCFHSLRAVSPKQIENVLTATDNSLPVHIHIAEQQKEVDDCVAWSGQRPVEWLLNQVGIDERWCLVHATHLNEAEIRAVAASKAVAGLCPTTEANLGDGIFPAVEYIRQGGRWGIGSDSHVSLSLVEELRTLEYSQRLRDQQRNRLALPQQQYVGDLLYRQASAGGNQACGVNIALSPGARADFLVLDHLHPFVAASRCEDLLNRWLFACSDNLIRHVFVAGQAVVQDFHHPAEEQARAGFTALLKRLFA